MYKTSDPSLVDATSQDMGVRWGRKIICVYNPNPIPIPIPNPNPNSELCVYGGSLILYIYIFIIYREQFCA